VKCHILFPFVDGPWGGGNQFLKAQRQEMMSRGVYCDDADRADVVFTNSHHWLQQGLALKRRRPQVRIVHRIDGPVALIRRTRWTIDQLIFDYIREGADAVVFQSVWSREQCLDGGLAMPALCDTIVNAPDSRFFFKAPRSPANERIRLVATSWSANALKGFDVYEALDRHLDFSRFEFTFIGNSPVPFSRARHLAPLGQEALGEELRRHDVYITGSVNDPCSNSLIEALHCGLPALARTSGGHPSIVGEQGVLFDGPEDVLPAIERLTGALELYRNRVNMPDIAAVTDRYLAVAEQSLVRPGKVVSATALLPLRARIAWLKKRGMVS